MAIALPRAGSRIALLPGHLRAPSVGPLQGPVPNPHPPERARNRLGELPGLEHESGTRPMFMTGPEILRHYSANPGDVRAMKDRRTADSPANYEAHMWDEKRKEADEGKLTESIKKDGVLVPISLGTHDGLRDKPGLLGGHHRVAAVLNDPELRKQVHPVMYPETSDKELTGRDKLIADLNQTSEDEQSYRLTHGSPERAHRIPAHVDQAQYFETPHPGRLPDGRYIGEDIHPDDV